MEKSYGIRIYFLGRNFRGRSGSWRKGCAGAFRCVLFEGEGLVGGLSSLVQPVCWEVRHLSVVSGLQGGGRCFVQPLEESFVFRPSCFPVSRAGVTESGRKWRRMKKLPLEAAKFSGLKGECYRRRGFPFGKIFKGFMRRRRACTDKVRLPGWPARKSRSGPASLRVREADARCP